MIDFNRALYRTDCPGLTPCLGFRGWHLCPEEGYHSNRGATGAGETRDRRLHSLFAPQPAAPSGSFHHPSPGQRLSRPLDTTATAVSLLSYPATSPHSSDSCHLPAVLLIASHSLPCLRLPRKRVAPAGRPTFCFPSSRKALSRMPSDGYVKKIKIKTAAAGTATLPTRS